MMKNLKWNRGSLTVEAACVMSLILLAVMGLIYLFFFVHNRAWLTAAAYEQYGKPAGFAVAGVCLAAYAFIIARSRGGGKS